MNIFNSLGSNYNFSFVLRTLFAWNNQKAKLELEQFLEEKYGGQVTLLYKGRQALELALKKANLPKNCFVAINGFTCFAVYEAIKKAGLKVEYLDIASGELNFSSTELEKHIKQNPKIKVVIVQNTLGYPCSIESIVKICKEKKLILIEDLAHCVGARYRNGKGAGTMGDYAVLSFSQDKMIDGISGGALISTEVNRWDLKNLSSKAQMIDRLYPLLTFLIRQTYSLGVGKIIHLLFKNLKLLSNPMSSGDQIQALPNWYSSLINFSFDSLSDNLIHRKKIASIYSANINPKITSNKINNLIEFSSNLRFPIFVNKREHLIKYLKQFGVYVSDIWYDAPIAPKRYLSQTDYRQGQCPNAELAAEEILNLPTHINVSEKDAQNIAQLINQWLKLQ